MDGKQTFDPIDIEKYFDGELSSKEMEALHEELVHDPTYGALSELRDAVRVESRLALHDIDGCALLDAINRQIDAEAKPAEPNPLSQPKRRTSKQFFARWAPAFVGAALFLLSIPGLVHWIAGAGKAESQQSQPAQTVVIVDSNGTKHAAQTNVVKFRHDELPPVPASEQLTVEEMDTALRLLMKRIENLEEVNRNSIESGARPIADVPQNAGDAL